MNNVIFQFMIDDGLDINIINNILGLVAPLPEIEMLQGRLRQQKKSRNEEYFEITIPSYTDIQFKEHFRMSRIIFETLLNVIGNHFLNADIQPYNNIPLSKRILFTIWLLSKQESFLAVGDRFGIPTSSGHGIFKYIVNAFVELMPQYVKWPNIEHQAMSSQIFEERSHGMSNVIGAIDGCHIPIKQPVRNATDFFNRKQFHSIILQGVCDHSKRFIDVFIGMPGRMHDARVFRNSLLFQKLTDQQNPLLQRNQHLIGDCAYPLMVNLMTPFRDNGHLLPSQVCYNMKLSKIRSVIEQTFALFKGKFRRLKYLDIADPEFDNNIIAATCMLHNFIIDNGDVYNDMDQEDDDVSTVHADALETTEHLSVAREAVEKRNYIVNNS